MLYHLLLGLPLLIQIPTYLGISSRVRIKSHDNMITTDPGSHPLLGGWVGSSRSSQATQPTPATHLRPPDPRYLIIFPPNTPFVFVFVFALYLYLIFVFHWICISGVFPPPFLPPLTLFLPRSLLLAPPTAGAFAFGNYTLPVIYMKYSILLHVCIALSLVCHLNLYFMLLVFKILKS